MQMPIDPSSMTRRRKRVGPEALEEGLKTAMAVALETRTAKPSSLERVTVGITLYSRRSRSDQQQPLSEGVADPSGPGEEGQHHASPEPHAPDASFGPIHRQCCMGNCEKKPGSDADKPEAAFPKIGLRLSGFTTSNLKPFFRDGLTDF